MDPNSYMGLPAGGRGGCLICLKVFGLGCMGSTEAAGNEHERRFSHCFGDHG